MTASRPIVVAVDRKTGSPDALRWADREARLRRRALRAVMAWQPPRPVAAPGGRATTTLAADEDPERAAALRLADYVRAALGAASTAECEVRRGDASRVLVTAAADAELVVLGEPRVAERILDRLPCPVVVLPIARTARPARPARPRGPKIGQTVERVGDAVLAAAAKAGRPGIGLPSH